MSQAVDLISMADIARLAGQSRATVGNWKARNPEDFPRERGQGSRGPLYDRAEVTAWLEATNRLDKRTPEVTAMWELADQFRGEMPTEDALPLLLVLLAVRSKAPSAQWKEVSGAAGRDLAEKLRAAALSLFPFVDELVPQGNMPQQALARAIATLSSLEQPRLAVMADTLLEQAAKAMGHRGGEFLSPPSVRRLVVAIAQPVGTVYNPATGVGQLMIDAATTGAPSAVHLAGQEINSRVWAMSQLNLAIHDVDADVALGDVFAEDHYPQLRADRVISVPPWNQRLPVVDRLTGDPRWVWGEPGPNDGNAAWTQHCLSHLADDGRAVIVLPNGALFEGGRAGRIRQRIVKAGLLDAVIALPPGLFAWTQIPCSVLVFSKGRRDVEGKPAPTLMIDLTQSAEAQGSRSTSLDDDLIDEVADLYRAWSDGKQPAVDYAAVASFDDLAVNEFVIDPGRYLSLPRTAPNLADATRTRAELIDRLAALATASREADAHLQSILEARR
jgi:predicted DNA-binding transcriptional regulator AlpA